MKASTFEAGTPIRGAARLRLGLVVSVGAGIGRGTELESRFLTGVTALGVILNGVGGGV